jgi:hypothetical protein
LEESLDVPLSSLLQFTAPESRDYLVASLVAIAHAACSAHDAHDDRSHRAARLLRAVARAEDAPHVVALALRLDRPLAVRDEALAALGALAATDARAAADAEAALPALLAEQPSEPHDGELAPRLERVVALARTDQARALVLGYLERAALPVSARLLGRGARDPAIHEAVVARWRARVDLEDPSPDDRLVTMDIAERSVAAPVMLAYWRARPERRGAAFWSDARFYPSLAGLADAAQRTAAATELRVGTGTAIEILGRGGLRHALRAAIHERSFWLRCPVERGAGEASNPRRDERDGERRYGRALDHLDHHPEGARIALELLRGGVLHEDVRAALVRLLWEKRRPWGRAWLAPRLRDPDALGELRAALSVARDSPSPDDAPMLRAALAVRDAQVRCLAIRALDALATLDGEVARRAGVLDAGLDDILASLAQSAPGAGAPESVVPLAAARSLVRRGHARFLPVLLAACRRGRAESDEPTRAFALTAVSDLARSPLVGPACVAELVALLSDVRWSVRATAIDGLANAPDPTAYAARFEAELRRTPGPHDEDADYARENAALALLVAAGERAIPALLQAAFEAPLESVPTIANALDVALSHAAGTPRARLTALYDRGASFWVSTGWRDA